MLDVSIENSASHRLYANMSYNSSFTTQLPVYTNIAPDKLHIALFALYNGPAIGTKDQPKSSRHMTNYKSYKPPEWIVAKRTRLGITGCQVEIKMKAAGKLSSLHLPKQLLDSVLIIGIVNTILKPSALHCQHTGRDVSLSRDFPASPVNCDITFNLKRQNFTDGDE